MKLQLGTKVKYLRGYHVKCSERFKDLSDKNTWVRSKTACPDYREGEGYIVGERVVIMDNYEYSKASYSEDGRDPAYANGKRESVYLVAKNARTLPFIVRKIDIVV